MTWVNCWGLVIELVSPPRKEPTRPYLVEGLLQGQYSLTFRMKLKKHPKPCSN